MLAVESCTRAFITCHSSDVCRSYAVGMFDACAMTSSGQCVRRHQCQSAVDRFYRLVPPVYSHSFLFCQCSTSPDDDRTCHTVRQAFVPSCLTAEWPPPSCHDVMIQCTDNTECKYVISVLFDTMLLSQSRRLFDSLMYLYCYCILLPVNGFPLI